MKKLRTIVIGCGHLGRVHARLLAEMDNVDLVAVVDPRPAARAGVAAETGARPLPDYRSLLGQVDAAVVAAPTSLHHAIAHPLIQAGVHLLVEKPLAADHAQCEQLVQLSRAHRVVLAVGHVERFNPAFVAAQQQLTQPLYIEATRSGGFVFRSLDVGVVHDLMVHDLELVLALVDSPVTSVSAVGAPVVTAYEDFAEARIVFGNGCVAELKASRTSPWAQRQMAIYDSQRHVFVDFGQRSAQMLERSRGLREGTLRVDRLAAAEVEALRPHIFQTLLPTAPLEVPNSNPLQDELRDFFACVRHGGSPRVDGPQAARAVWLAEQVVAQIQASPQRPAIPPHRRAA